MITRPRMPKNDKANHLNVLEILGHRSNPHINESSNTRRHSHSIPIHNEQREKRLIPMVDCVCQVFPSQSLEPSLMETPPCLQRKAFPSHMPVLYEYHRDHRADADDQGSHVGHASNACVRSHMHMFLGFRGTSGKQCNV